MKLSEMFNSIQGEGRNTGRYSVFIRFQGCNLECNWCDTKYSTTPVGKTIDVMPKEILEYVIRKGANHVVFTGGEPLLFKKDIIETLKILPNNVSVEIETNGTQRPLPSKYRIQYSVSPKLANSGMQIDRRFRPDIIEEFIERDSIFKFVIRGVNDVEEIRMLLGSIRIPSNRIWFMPLGSTTSEYRKTLKTVANICTAYGYNLSPRLHVEIWGNKRGR